MTRARPMPRVGPASMLVALLALVSGLLLPALVLGASAAQASVPGSAPTRVRTADDPTPASPLTVRLVRLSPATMPKQGTITLAGSVHNSSSEEWSAINVHPFVSRTPMTTRDELADAAASDPDAEVGTRLTQPGQFAAIGDLAPGQTTRFLITLSVADLGITGDPGVYWIGVHALGTNAEGRDGLADGRARTFIPLVRGARHSAVSLVVPIRERVRRDADARLLDSTDWSETFASEGRLRRIVDLLGTASPGTADLLIDPAVLEAAESVQADNPALSFGKSAGDGGSTPSSTPTATPSGQPTDGPTANDTSRSLRRLDATDQANATTWLSAMIDLTKSHSVLGLGYADPDTSALARRKPTMLTRAEKLSTETFARLGITETPTVAPPDGWLDDDALSSIAAGSLVLVSDHDASRVRTQWRTSDDQELVFADSRASDGGPGPTAPLDALALRQRILSDAALRAQSGLTSPMVVELPSDWDPGTGWRAAHFFDGLDQPWLDLVGLGGTPAAGTPTLGAQLGYPASERKLEVGSLGVASARQLVITGTTVSQLLRTDNQVDHVVSGLALSAVSYHSRADPVAASDEVLATDAALRDRAGAVQVIGTNFVTLSGGSGTLAVTLVNGLDQPVRAGIAMTSTGDGVTITSRKPVDLAPGERVVLRLRARATAIGVHEVTLSPMTSGRQILGTPLTFSLRTSQVGALIWIVIIAALLLLVVMIGRRILRGVREHRWRGQ